MELHGNAVKGIILAVLLLILGGIFGARYFRAAAPRTAARAVMEQFFAALDRGDVEACRKLFADPKRAGGFAIERRTLGALKTPRKEHSRSELRFGDRRGLRAVFRTGYENAPAIREEITVLERNDKAEVILFRFHHQPLPAANFTTTSYNGGEGDAIRGEVFAFYDDFAQGRRAELDAVTFRRCGYINRGTVNRWLAFRKQYGKPAALLIASLKSAPLPGESDVTLCRVAVRATYRVNRREQAVTQYVDLVRRANDKKPEFQVYSFEHGKIARPGKKAPLKK